MPQYVFLMTVTQAGAADVDSLPRHEAEIGAIVTALHGESALFLYTMGPYDVVLVAGLPDDESAACLALRIVQAGFFKTVTMRAFTSEQAVQAFGKK